MTRYVTTRQMRRFEELAKKRYGISTLLLMENAGRSVAEAIQHSFARKVKNILVLSGQGNNGGDGFVTARHLNNRGYRVTTLFFGRSKRLKPDALVNFNTLKKMKLRMIPALRMRQTDVRKLLKQADLVVDALFGTGLKQALRKPYPSLVTEVNHAGRKVVAVDIPSGLDSDRGTVCGEAIRSHTTIALGFLKAGMRRRTAKKYCGRILVGDISLPKGIQTKR